MMQKPMLLIYTHLTLMCEIVELPTEFDTDLPSEPDSLSQSDISQTFEQFASKVSSHIIGTAYNNMNLFSGTMCKVMIDSTSHSPSDNVKSIATAVSEGTCTIPSSIVVNNTTDTVSTDSAKSASEYSSV